MGWIRFSRQFINADLHICICGRAGYEYDMEENEDGKKELIKTGIKMKAEGEFGFEPSLLVNMEMSVDPKPPNRVTRVAHILKDRSRSIDGQSFQQPTFDTFAPHIDFLNLGGVHFGCSTEDSQELFDENVDTRWKREKKAKEIALDEIIEVLNKHHGGTSKDAKDAKANLLEQFAGTRSWKRIEQTFRLDQIEKLRNDLWLQLEVVPWNFQPPVPDDQQFDDDIPGSVEGSGSTPSAADGQTPTTEEKSGRSKSAPADIKEVEKATA